MSMIKKNIIIEKMILKNTKINQNFLRKSCYISLIKMMFECVRFSGWQYCVSGGGVSTEGVGSREAALPESAQRVFQTGAEIRQPEGGGVSDQGDFLSSKHPTCIS